ncbi:hypothetical protein SAMN05444401_2581 [Clostridium amylolyticum]|uniref:HEPN domain-containing protein n=1 Tax=Clostridium amylolyticum TaxID=1121298 RepID=A0A1M6HMS9_9CLOT|nr:hypothetical protein [Clostridium amylolyticum]SHJ23541.1 hypothetical protein SAMN05444401_2581 [Clostridium amylolyticum]
MIFSYNKDIRKTAYMNWRTDPNNTEANFGVIANGYFISAKVLTEKYIENNIRKDADVVIYPILFNTIHGIELYLKAIYMKLAYILKKEQQYAGGHNIKGLLGMVSNLVKELKNNKEQFKQYKNIIKDVEQFIDEVYLKTDKMDFARYSVDNKKKENYFYIDNIENEIVNLPVLLDKINKMHEALEQLLSHFLYDYEEEDYI